MVGSRRALPPRSPPARNSRRHSSAWMRQSCAAMSAPWMQHHLYGTIIPDAFIARLEAAADPAREGLGICVELIEELSTIPGVAGVHIMAPSNDAAIPEAIKGARARIRRAAL